MRHKFSNQDIKVLSKLLREGNIEEISKFLEADREHTELFLANLFNETPKRKGLYLDGVTCWNLGYCCSLTKPCPNRALRLTQLNIHPKDYFEAKNLFGILIERLALLDHGDISPLIEALRSLLDETFKKSQQTKKEG